MKKNYLLLLLIFVLVVSCLVVAFKNPVNQSYVIKEAGYTYSPKGEVVKFSKHAKYNNTWINNEKTIEDHSKKQSIDIARTLFLENKETQFLGKSVAIISKKQLDELPSFTHIKAQSESYIAKTDEGKTISQIPKGTMAKLAEGKYILLDSANLQNTSGLDKKLKELSLVTIDKNKMVRINEAKKTDEMASSDLVIKLDNSNYNFDLTNEQLINRDDPTDVIDVRAIKIELDDRAEAPKMVQQSTSEEATDVTSSKASSEETTKADNDSKQQSSTDFSGSANENVKTDNVSSPDSGSNGKQTNEGSGTTSAVDELTEKQKEEINDIVKKINDLEQTAVFKVPLINVEAIASQLSISGKLTISDPSERLDTLSIKLLANNKVIKQQEVAVTQTEANFSFENLQYGHIYQLIVEGNYRYNQKDVQSVTFYRKNFVLSPVKIDKKIIERGADFLKLQLKASDQGSHIDELSLKYKVNNSQNTTSQSLSVNVEELNEDQRTMTVKIENLASNQEYLMEMAKLVVDGQEVTDTSWYLIGKTKKQLPTMKGIALEYNSVNSQMTLTPEEILDPNDTITSIRYVIYSQDDYTQQGEAAHKYASATVNGNNKNSLVHIGRTGTMPDGNYVAVAYVTGNDDQSDYNLAPILSNSVTVGMKSTPTIRFELDEAQQDSLKLRYELFDQDETLIFNELSNPVFYVYSADAQGNLLSDRPVKQVDVRTKEALTNSLFIDGLASESYYVISFVASYNLDNGGGIQVDQEIGRSSAFKTLRVQNVIAQFTQVSAQTDQATVNVKLDHLGRVLKKAILEVKNLATDTVVQTLPINLEMITTMLTKDGLDLTISNLAHNEDYQVAIIEAYDSGKNQVTVEGKGTLKTRKIAPVAEKVLLDYKPDTAELRALVAKSELEKMIDEDQSVALIVFQIFKKEADQPVAENAEPLAEKVTTTNFDAYTYFNLEANKLGRGKSYIIRANVQWNDRYDNHYIELQSNPITVDQKIPEVEFQILKRDADGISLKPLIADPDKNLVDDEITLTNGTETVKAKNEETVTVPHTGSTKVQAQGAYRLQENGPVHTAVLQEKQLLPLTDIAPNVTNQLTLDKEKRQLRAEAQANDGNGTIMAGRQALTYNNQLIYDNYLNGAEALMAQKIPLPNEAAAIWFNNNYDFSLETTAFYAENKMDNERFAGYYNISLDEGNKFVSSQNGKILTTNNRANATLYTINDVVLGKEGEIAGLTLKNQLTKQYLGVSNDSLTDNHAQAYPFTLKREPNGSYVLMAGKQYVNFNTGIVTSKGQASIIDFYSANSVTTALEQMIELPELTAPYAEITQVATYDKRITMDFKLTDTDQVVLKNTKNKPQLYISVYETDSTESVQKHQVNALTEVHATLNGLQPKTDYTVKIEAVYDLLEGDGQQHEVLASQAFTTLAAAPEIVKTTYNWSPNIYVENGRKIVNTTNFNDESEILDTIEYRLYELTKDISYTTNVETMAAILQEKTPVTTYYSKESDNAFPLYDEKGRQRFVSGKTYIIAAYVKTTDPEEVPDFLGNINKITIAAPITATSTLEVTTVTSKQADLVFSYNDAQGYILSGNTKPFTYVLTETNSGNPATYVDGYQGTFTGSNAATWLKHFQGLNPSTGYTLTISADMDNLDGLGARLWQKSVLFTTSDEYVTSNPLIYILSGNNLMLKVSNVNNGSATINRSRLVLYQYDVQTNTMGSELASKELPLPNNYPVNFEENFNVQTLMNNEYLMARLEVTYDTNLGETNQIYSVQNVVYLGGGQRSRQPMKVTLTAGKASVTLDHLPDSAETYTAQILDKGSQVINAQEINKETLTALLDTDNQAVKRIEIRSQEEQLMTAYETNAFQQTVTAYTSDQQTVFSMLNADPDATYMLHVLAKNDSGFNSLPLMSQEVGESKAAIRIADDLSLLQLPTKLPVLKTYQVTGAMLTTGYPLLYSMNQYNFSLQEAKTGNNLILQKVEVLR